MVSLRQSLSSILTGVLLVTSGCYEGPPDAEAAPWEGDSKADVEAETDGVASDDDDAGGTGGATTGPGEDPGDSSPDPSDDPDPTGEDPLPDPGDDPAGSESTGGEDDPPPPSDEVPDNAYCVDVGDWDPAFTQLENEILEIVNQRRAEGADCGTAGVFGPAGPLSMDPALRCAARVHSQDMVDRNYFDHTNPSGESPFDRMGFAGYSYSTAGENIAAGNSTAAATMQQWMDSDGHCGNIMKQDFTELGVGYYPGGQYGHVWTQAFGAP